MTNNELRRCYERVANVWGVKPEGWREEFKKAFSGIPFDTLDRGIQGHIDAGKPFVTVPELVSRCKAVKIDSGATSSVSEDCEICDGTGTVSTEAIRNFGGESRKYEYIAACGCKNGDKFRDRLCTIYPVLEGE